MKVVAKKYWLGLSSNLGSTAIFTSVEGGDYLLTVYVAISPNINNDDLQIGVSTTTDPRGNSNPFQFGSSGNQQGPGGGGIATCVIPLYLYPGDTVSINVTGTASGSSYDVRSTVVDLAAPGL